MSKDSLLQKMQVDFSRIIENNVRWANFNESVKVGQ